MGETVTLNASESTDSDGTIVQYGWDFGDGSGTVVTEVATVEHTYSGAGNYVPRAVVTDGDGLVIGAGEKVPELVVTDRSHWRLIERAVVMTALTAALIVGFTPLGICYALGRSLV